MSVDTISNMLSSIKNASMVNKDFIEVPHTKVCEEVAKSLKGAGFLENVKVFKDKDSGFKMLNLALAKDEEGNSKITELKRVSKPGLRVYKPSDDLRRVRGGYGVAVISTNRGIVLDSEARKKKLGGEVICIAW
ncbi:MAG: 30S ribosomal protein S8 [Patescibacteria group bacterium]